MTWDSRKAVGCPVERALTLIEGRWKVMVLYHLFAGTQRFNALARLLVGITPRTLAKQLREMEDAGLVHREAYAEIPPRVEYSLTPLGRSLEPVLASLHRWGEEHGTGS